MTVGGVLAVGFALLLVVGCALFLYAWWNEKNGGNGGAWFS